MERQRNPDCGEPVHEAKRQFSKLDRGEMIDGIETSDWENHHRFLSLWPDTHGRVLVGHAVNLFPNFVGLRQGLRGHKQNKPRVLEDLPALPESVT
jgi:hypothetical protein